MPQGSTNTLHARLPLFCLAGLRVLMGLVFLLTAIENSAKGLYGEGFRGYVAYLANGNPIGWYRAFLETVILPNWQVVAQFQAFAEYAMGITLILGLFTPLTSLGGIFFFINLLLASWGREWPWTYGNMIAILLAVGISGAGRWVGVDYLLERVLPPRLNWMASGLAAPHRPRKIR